MKTFTALFLGLCCLSNSSFAGSDWIGNFKVQNMHRGSLSTYDYSPSNEIAANICGYNIYSVTFEVYKAGVTDAPGVSIWQYINVSVQTVDSQNNLIKTGTPIVAGMDGNNAVYSVSLSDIAPSAVTGIAPTSQFSNLKITVDGQVITAPVQFTCVNNG